MKNLVELYAAMGGVVSEDGKTVMITADTQRPIDIVLKVFPRSIEMDQDGEKVTFDILVDDKMIIDPPTPTGHPVRWVTYEETFTIPIEAVSLLDDHAKDT